MKFLLILITYYPGYYCQGDVPFHTHQMQERSTRATCEASARRIIGLSKSAKPDADGNFVDPIKRYKAWCEPL